MSQFYLLILILMPDYVTVVMPLVIDPPSHIRVQYPFTDTLFGVDDLPLHQPARCHATNPDGCHRLPYSMISISLLVTMLSIMCSQSWSLDSTK